MNHKNIALAAFAVVTIAATTALGGCSSKGDEATGQSAKHDEYNSSPAPSGDLDFVATEIQFTFGSYTVDSNGTLNKSGQPVVASGSSSGSPSGSGSAPPPPPPPPPIGSTSVVPGLAGAASNIEAFAAPAADPCYAQWLELINAKSAWITACATFWFRGFPLSATIRLSRARSAVYTCCTPNTNANWNTTSCREARDFDYLK